ncbi:RNA ligase/cyclic nucleotide phosphodiesterase [Legionella moravica]|uniref:RNA 2',3'-cyclic phosphodiesterase n=1 Tax=Legionella moravica TaxID=39962 RepID=A0A378K038_9GAMM|nr:RNA 2',3'-cyclic phosphodiesterase [Legionella moravica]KTD37420.1 RNA ligase/cyclic nucleotide phosphodiesterase [Legionella moravica]STX63102.1 RNA ligase/cyclic nucleotide phosphodiesterase [Legionella moravica]
MKTMRSFFAIMMDPSIQNYFSTHLTAVKRCFSNSEIKWSKLEYLHITLQFLSSIKSDCVPHLMEQVQRSLDHINSFQLELGPLEWFPTSSNPKILSCAVGPHSILNELSALIGHELTTMNIPIDTRPFRAHMTLGRIVSNQRLANPVDLTHIKLPPLPPMTVNKVYFVESKPQKEGSHYSLLAPINLKPNGHNIEY